MILLQLFGAFLFLEGIYGGRLREDSIPQEPTQLTLETPAPGTVKAKWFPPLDGSLRVRGYKVQIGERIPDGEEQTVDARTLTAEFTGLPPNQRHIVSVRAFNEVGDGIPDYEVIDTLPDSGDNGGSNGGGGGGGGGGDTSLESPIVSASAAGSDQVSVEWTGIQGATDGRSYRLRYKTKPPSRWTNVDTTETSYLVTGLEPNTLYEFAVKLKRGSEESLWSISIFERTDDGPPSNNTGPSTTCEEITAVPMCSSVLPYTEAQLPNMLGHTNQGSITGELSSLWLPIVLSGCSPFIHAFVCSSYLPSCNPDGPIVPCRETCLRVRSECQAVIDNIPDFSWPEELACESLPSEADGDCIAQGTPGSEEPPAFCEPVTVPMCMEDRFTPPTPPGAPRPEEYPLPPWANYTKYPNFIGQNNQEDTAYFTLMVDRVVTEQCSPILKFFVCLAVAPMCTPVPVPIPPCRELCEMATAPCLGFMESEGISWPVELECDKFPPSSVTQGDGPPACIGFTAEGGLGPAPGNETGGSEGNGDGEPKGPERELIFNPPDVETGIAECEPLSDSAKELCPGLEYTETIFPNTLGHGDQEEAYEMLNTQSEILGKECSIGLFLCVLAFPPCKRYGENNDSVVPLLPCREECAYTKTSCVDVDFDGVISSISKYSMELDCGIYAESYANPPLCWEITNGFLQPEPKPTSDLQTGPPKEEGLCSSDISDTCKSYGLKKTAFPNAFGHANSTDVTKAYEELQPLIDSQCSPDLSSFACASFYPVCDAEENSVMPCHETCRKVWKACKTTASDLGMDRPKLFSCSKLFIPKDEGHCLTSFQAPTAAPLLKGIGRGPDNAVLDISPEDDSAKFFNTKLYDFSPDPSSGPAREATYDVEDAKFTTVKFDQLAPEKQYYAEINTANEFGQSPSILETIPKHDGIECMELQIDMCKGYGYDMGLADGVPNRVGNIDQAEAMTNLEQFQPLINVGCSPSLEQLLCWVFAPGCSEDVPELIPPCRDTCQEARFGCEHLMNAFGYQWPPFLECDLFPFRNDTDAFCEGGNRLAAYGEISSDDGANYLCKKMFEGESQEQPSWLDPEGNEVGDDNTQEVYTEIVSDMFTRLVVNPVSRDNEGTYKCQSGENEVEAANIKYFEQGTCIENNHEMCVEYFDTFYLPNRHNQTNEREAYLSVNTFIPVIATNCSEYITLFACYYYLPNNYCGSSNTSSRGAGDAPCKELCYKAQLDCMEEMEEIGFLWPEDIDCESLPSEKDRGGRCESFGVTELDILTEGNVTEVEFVTDIYDDLNATDTTDIYPTDATEFATGLYDDENATDTTEFYTAGTEEPYTTGNYTEEYLTTVITEEVDGDNLTCISAVMPRRYDIEDLGSDCLFRGWADVQGQGAANDYCRVVTKGGPKFLSCALAGSTDDHVYTSPNASVDWFDAGHTDTWYMRDEDEDGRDDYCRCIGVPPDTVVSCMKAGDNGFISHDDFQIEDSTECEYHKVNPFFGAP